MTRAPRALLFDLDDTLIEEEPARDAALVATARSAGRSGLDPRALAAEVRRVARVVWWDHPLHDFAYGIGVASWEALWARFEGDGPELTALRAWAPEYRATVWQGALEAFGIDDRALAGALAERFPVERRRIHRSFPDVVPALRALREDGRFRLGLVTNGLSCLQREKLRGAGLERWFDAVVAGGDVGSRKPAHEVFDAILRLLRSDPGDAWMIGNNPETDIRGALDAGIDATWIVRDGIPPREAPGGLDGVPVIGDLHALIGRLGVTISGPGSVRPPRA